MDFSQTLTDLRAHLDLCCWNPEDASELIQAAALAAQFKIPRISVAASSVPAVWSWLEKSDVSVSALLAWNSDKSSFQDLVRDMAAPLKRGANEVQLYVKFQDLEALSNNLSAIKDEIFFGKKLSVALGMDGVPYNGWTDAFNHLNEVRADNIMLIAKNIKTLDQNYYNFLDSLQNYQVWGNWGIEVCAAAGAIKPLEDILRLTQKMMPERMKSLRLIVRPEFMKNYKAEIHEDI